MSNSVNIFQKKLLNTLEADTEKCENYIEGSLAMCTTLSPIIGYDKATQIAYEAYKSNKTIREVLKSKKILSEKEINQLLDPSIMIKPK